MKKFVLRTACIAGAVMLVGPVCGWLTGAIPSGDGGPEATALLSASPVLGLGLCLGALLLAALTGLVAARLVGPSDGLFCAGLALAWGAWGAGRLDGVIRATDSSDPFTKLAVEGAILGVVAFLAMWGVLRLGRDESRQEGDVPWARQGGVAMGVATLVGLVAAWILARDESIGQTFAAAVAAGVLGAMAGRVSAFGAPLTSLIAAIPIAAVVAPLVGRALSQPPLQEQIYAGTIHSLALVMPLDWLAGMLVGIPVGAHWAHGLVEHQSHSDAKKPARARPAAR